MKLWKKLMSVLLCLVLLLSLLPAGTAGAVTFETETVPYEEKRLSTSEYTVYPTEGGDLYYDPATGTITGSDEFITFAEIPSEIAGVPITAIADGAFAGRSLLSSVTIPDTVTTIGKGAFNRCFDLSSITIPSSVISIGPRAFADCSCLRSITIPDGLTTLGKEVFAGCSSLEDIWVGEENENYSSDEQGALYNKDKTVLIRIPGNYSGEYTVSDTVTTIDAAAFDGCYRLTGVIIPNTVTTIGDSAFSECNALTEITIPDSVTSVGGYAFFCCSLLTSITIGSGVATIGEYAFYGCDSLMTVWVREGNETYSSDQQGNLYDRDKTVLIMIPQKHSGDFAIPHSVTTIGDYAFAYCEDLTSVTIPDSVTAIGDYAFTSCTGLTGITIPNGVTSIGESAFYRCENIASVNIPDGLTNISDGLFASCKALTSITIPDGITTIGRSAFSNCDRLADVTIGRGVTTLVEQAFYGCNDLRRIIIPENVTTIGRAAFGYCYNLERVMIFNAECDIYDSKDTFGASGRNFLFGYMGSTTEAYGAKHGYRFIPLEVGEPIIAYPVEGGNIYFDKLIGTIIDCDPTVTSAVIPAEMEGYPVTTIGADAFEYCDQLTDIVIPDTVTTIGSSAFYSCSALTAIEIPGSVTTIPKWTFWNCHNLESIILGDGVTSIGAYAFYNCTAATIITLTNSVTSVGDFAFYNTILTDVYYYGTKEQWDTMDVGMANGAFYYMPTIHYMESVEEPEMVETLKLAHSLNLESNISINYVVSATALEQYDSYEIRCYIGDKVSVPEATKKNGYIYFTLTDINALQMSETVQAEIYAYKDGKTYVSPLDEYSIVTYATNMMNRDGVSQQVKEICANLLRYGAASQTYMGYNVENLADANLTEVQRGWLVDTESVVFNNRNAVLDDLAEPTVKWAGKTLILGSNVCLKIVVDGSAYEGALADLELRVAYKSVKGDDRIATAKAEIYNASKKQYMFVIDQLSAPDLRAVLSCRVYAGDVAVSQTMEYSADTYGNGKTGALLELCKALFAYVDKTESYFAK